MSRIFDCCMVFNELDMLELRMNILGDVVDYFVVVEAGMTHSGQHKPAYFGEALRAGRFDAFQGKILYAYTPHLQGDHSWLRERWNRGYIATVLNAHAALDDWVIIADADEIPNPAIVRELPKVYAHDGTPCATFELDFYYYDFHHRVQQGWGIGACLWGIEQDPNRIRRSEFNSSRTPYSALLPKARNGGWHLSYFAQPEQVIAKLDAFMHHADVAADVPRDPAWLGERMRAGEDIFGRGLPIDHVEQPRDLPRYVLQHADKYQALGWLK